MAISKLPSAGFQDNVKFRNKIVNGDISVDQRNETSTINATGVTYNVDRFLGRGVSSAGVFTLVQDTTSPDDFINSIKATVTTADSSISSGSSYRLQTNIEGYNMSDMNWGSSSAHNAVLSFYVKSSVTGTFGGSIANGGFDRFRVFSYTINSADTWERKTISIPGDTSGTWSTDNTLSVRINWSLGAGSTYLGSTGSWSSSAKEGVTGQTNLIATNSSTFFLTGVQFEKNTAPSSFEFLPFDVNLQRCQRYYQLLGSDTNKDLSIGTYYTSTHIFGSIDLKQVMRATPSLDIITGTNYYVGFRNGGSDSLDTFTLSSSSQNNSIVINNNSEASGTAGQGTMLRTNNANAFIAADSEL